MDNTPCFQVEDSLQSILDKVPSYEIKVKTKQGFFRVKGDTKDLQTFKRSCLKCSVCQDQAFHFVLTFSKKQIPSLNLISIKGCLLTSDYIIPISKGGKENLSNRRVICSLCKNFLLTHNDCFLNLDTNSLVVFYNEKENYWVVRIKYLGTSLKRPKYAVSFHSTKEKALEFSSLISDKYEIRPYERDLPLSLIDVPVTKFHQAVLNSLKN